MNAAPTLPALDDLVSQETFRALLEALSHPGKPVQLPPSAIDPTVPAALTVPLALADVEVRLCVATEAAQLDWGGALRGATGCVLGELEDAEMAIGLRPLTPEELRTLPRGRCDAPELGARLVLACAELRRLGGGSDSTDGAVVLTLAGPGVPGAVRLEVHGLPVEVFETLEGLNRDFPLGIDTFLVDHGGAVVGIPRSSRIVVEKGVSAWATQR